MLADKFSACGQRPACERKPFQSSISLPKPRCTDTVPPGAFLDQRAGCHGILDVDVVIGQRLPSKPAASNLELAGSFGNPLSISSCQLLFTACAPALEAPVAK